MPTKGGGSRQADNANLPYWLMTLPYGRANAEAPLSWSEECLETHKRRAWQEEPTWIQEPQVNHAP